MVKYWSGPRPHIERPAALTALQNQVDAAVAEGGRAAFLMGPTGAGVTHCLGIFQEQAHRAHRALKAAYVNCAESGESTWLETADLFTRGHRLKRSAQRVVVEWAEAVPIVGKLLQAIGKTIAIMRGIEVEDRKKRKPRASGTESAIQAVRTLLEFEPQEPRLIIMDSLDRGDAEDMAGARALFRRMSETRTLFVAGVRTRDGRPPREVNDLILEAERLGIAHRVELEPPHRRQLSDALGIALKSEVPDEWMDWLMARAGGYPGRLWSALGELEDSGSLVREGRSWRFQGEPAEDYDLDRDAGALGDLGSDLSPDDRRLLALAALEGVEFHSAVLAELAGRDELEIEDTLARLARQKDLIEFRGTPTLAGEVTSLYGFRRSSDVRAFAGSLPAADRESAALQLERVRKRLGLG